MRRFIFIIIGLFCALTMYAVSYASPYKGSAHGGYVAQPVYHSVGVSSVAQRPTATMGSTSAYRGTINSGVMATVKPIRGIYTSASAVRGGVTAGQTYGRMNGPRKKTALPDGACDDCPWQYDEEKDEWYCPYCDCEPEDGHCDHHCVPIGDGWDVWLFMAVLGTGYAFVARRREELKAKS